MNIYTTEKIEVVTLATLVTSHQNVRHLSRILSIPHATLRSLVKNRPGTLIRVHRDADHSVIKLEVINR